MNILEIFIHRPIATTLLSIGLVLSGMTAYFLLPASPLPNIDIPTISVTASMAGDGAVLVLLVSAMRFSLIVLIGVILLIGIVKKNAMIMVDFAIEAQRNGLTPPEAVYRACLLRFRP